MNRPDTPPRSFSTDRLRDALGDVGGPPRPDYLTDIVAQAGRTGQRPGWTSTEWWHPASVSRQADSRLAVLFATLVLLALLAAASILSGSQRTRPVDLGIFEPVAGWIVYGNQDGIWGVDPAASKQTPVQVTADAGTPLGWSSDGTRLLIQKGNENLFVLHADGSETQVTDQLSGFSEISGSSRPSGATISPDGSRVVFAGLTRREAGRSCHDGALFAIDSDGGPATVLWESHISQNGIVRAPTFSPDGTRIAFVDGYCDSSHGVWVMNADGSDAHQIVPTDFGPLGATHVYGLAWSPAGDRLALAIDDGIYTFAADGSGFTHVTSSGYWPQWSPDGSRIASTFMCADRFEGCGMAIAGADGSDLQRMGFGPSGSVGVAGPWHPGTHTASVVRPVAPAPSPAVATPREATSSPETLPTESPKPVPAPTVTAAAVPVAYDLLDGAVTYRAPDNLLPSQDGYSGHDRLALVGILPDDDAPRRVIVMLSDPQPIGPTCAGDPAPPDAEALARSIRSDPDLEATAPVATTIGGVPALQMDVLLAIGASSCRWSEHGTSGEGPLLLDHLPFAAMPFFGDRARVWLMDLPEGSGARVLTIAVITDEDSFETVLKSAMPVIRSVGVHPA